ncbi:MAG: hypothetical protein ACTSO3_16745 [Candidatus Heimdallarchaeaceae archaeon]
MQIMKLKCLNENTAVGAIIEALKIDSETIIIKTNKGIIFTEIDAYYYGDDEPSCSFNNCSEVAIADGIVRDDDGNILPTIESEEALDLGLVDQEYFDKYWEDQEKETKIKNEIRLKKQIQSMEDNLTIYKKELIKLKEKL